MPRKNPLALKGLVKTTPKKKSQKEPTYPPNPGYAEVYAVPRKPQQKPLGR